MRDYQTPDELLIWLHERVEELERRRDSVKLSRETANFVIGKSSQITAYKQIIHYVQTHMDISKF